MMKRFLDFLPAFFCVLYLEYLVFVLNDDESSVGSLVCAGPLLGLVLAVALFFKRSGFWQRFSRFKRCLLLYLTTMGIACVATGILTLFSSGSANPFETVLVLLVLSAEASILLAPLALFISGLYCLPLWAWEGRNDPDHFTGKLVLGFPSYRRRVLWMSSLGIVLLLVFFWHRRPASPSWMNSVPGDGEVLSLISGKSPNGTEVVLAGGYYRSDQSGNDLHVLSLDALDGHQLWSRSFQWALPNMGRIPTLANDPKGDVIVAWNYWANSDIPQPLISKFSGTDGRMLWEKLGESGQTPHDAARRADTQWPGTNLDSGYPPGSKRPLESGLDAP